MAAIELLSPSNKRVGGGREEYLERRDKYLNGDVHLIEIDLLRRGTRLPMRGALPSVWRVFEDTGLAAAFAAAAEDDAGPAAEQELALF